MSYNPKRSSLLPPARIRYSVLSLDTVNAQPALLGTAQELKIRLCLLDRRRMYTAVASHSRAMLREGALKAL
jgi:hypothetical protein